MSKDIVFNQERKVVERKTQKHPHYSEYRESHSVPLERFLLPIRDFEPLKKVYDYVNGYNQEEQKFMRGRVMQVIWAEKKWCYCIRPDNNQNAFWTRLIM